MADEPQRLLSPLTQQNPPSPSKFYSHFLFKALVAVFFFIIVPIIPSIAPNFLNQSILIKSWELVHVVFFGIAVSYGLFSRRCSDSGAETPSKFGAAQSYVSGLLQFPSASHEEGDSSNARFDDCGNKVQSWSSRYVRKEPVVVLAKKQSAEAFNGEKMGSVSVMGDNKPLFLPVRSLKSSVSDENGDSGFSERRFRRSSSYASSSARYRSLKSRVSGASADDEEPHEMDPNLSTYQPSRSSNSSSDSWSELQSKRSEDLGKNQGERSRNDFSSVQESENESEDFSEEESENEEDENGKEEDDASDYASSNGFEDEGPDVDKKAGEFIARFKEQIRLQRIESIRSSTAPFSGIFVR